MRNGGIHNGVSLLEPMWVVDTFANGDTQAWGRGEFFESFPKGAYRNQWYSIGDGELCAIGIHGQWIYIDYDAGMVAVKQSSQPVPDDEALDNLTYAMFQAIADELR